MSTATARGQNLRNFHDPEHQRRAVEGRYAIPGTRVRIPAERFVDLLLDYARRNASVDIWEHTHGDTNQLGVTGWLALQTGLNKRIISAYLNGTKLGRSRPKHTSFDLVDRVLCRLELTYLWHVPADQGGLADLYEGTAE